MLVQSPVSGRVLAMQGGFDAGLGSFNRATQALRQPGSTIKPFVYATGLDYGMTPATQVLDGAVLRLVRARASARNASATSAAAAAAATTRCAGGSSSRAT